MSQGLPLITDAEVGTLLQHGPLVDALDAAFADLAQGEAAVQARHRIDCGPAKLSNMGGIWQARHAAAVKSYITVDGQFSFLVNLFDTAQRKPLAVLEANELTRFRTAALTRLVARKATTGMAAPRKLAVFGAGLQGRTQAEVLCEEFDLQQVCFVDPVGDAAWVQAFGQRMGVDAQLCMPQAAVTDADLVVTASRSKKTVLDGEWLKPGAVVVAMGTSLPNGSELDNATFRRAGRLLVEWKPQSLVEAGEVVQALSAGVLSEADVVDLPQLYRNEAPWRRSAQDIVVFKSVGIGLTDVVAAYSAWQAASGRTGA
ncbi:ornithine cyclodeaminase family protein [Comamonas terrigena]|uniref:ornithine cyclodeaminase family protein n=1 Tax=Comamonas terrigena TaxID=32013 RepID=UPI002352ED25|nr:ornithine cyclodeaminase family protein [Comamonas terrigena]